MLRSDGQRIKRVFAFTVPYRIQHSGTAIGQHPLHGMHVRFPSSLRIAPWSFASFCESPLRDFCSPGGQRDRPRLHGHRLTGAAGAIGSRAL